MKTNTLLAIAALSSAVAADETENITWPIADPFAAFRATAEAVSRVSVNTRVVWPLATSPQNFGTPSPFLASFNRREREPFSDFVSRAAGAASMKTADLVAMTMRDRSGIQICRLDFSARASSPTNFEINLHGALHVPGAACVPIDVPDRYLSRRLLLWAPTFGIGQVFPDRFPSPDIHMEVREAFARDGRIYFPWILVADDMSAVAIEATLREEPNGGLWYLSASTVGRERGRVTASRQPPAWWPRETPAPVALEDSKK